MIEVPRTKQDSALLATIWIDGVQVRTTFFIVRPLTAEPPLFTTQTQLVISRSSKVITKILTLF